MNKNDIQNLSNGNGTTEGKGNGFYNTIHLKGSELAKAKKQVESQEAKIMELFKKNPKSSFTKSEIKQKLVLEGKLNDRTPESSISRALNSLMKDRLVLKTPLLRNGSYGKPNHLWQIVPSAIQAGTQTELF